MKKRLLVLSVCTAMIVSMTACGASKSNDAANSAIDVPGVTVDVSSEETYTYVEKSQYDDTSTTYILGILDDKNASLSEVYEYNENNTTSYNYKGTYEKTENTIVFTYEDVNAEEDLDGGFKRIFELENGEITGALSEDKLSINEIVGSYKGTSDAFGDVTLKIEKGGKAILVTATDELEGNIYKYQDKWDFTYYPEDGNQESIDWMVTFDGDSFTYTTYQNYMYGDYAGSYTAKGQLGTISIQLFEDGTAATSVNYNGMTLNMSGSFYTDTETKQITSLYFYCDEGYTMDINLTEVDGEWNYSGSFSFPLAAG